jgi:glycosyltransferase involved in cell wall biosynthesis
MWYNILGMISEEFALAHHIKHVITVCGQDVLPENPFLKDIQQYSGTLICPSPFQKNKLLENHEVPVRLIPWGIQDIQASNDARTIDLIQCGWINAVKNNFLFLDLVQILKETNLIKKVLICGGGPMFDELQQKIQSKHLSDVIELKNATPRVEVLKYMQQSKILVHTSQFESFGLVLAEALACNCMVISTPVGIAHDNKNILQAFNKEDFISKISAALKKENSKAPFKNEYPIAKTVADHLMLYKEK